MSLSWITEPSDQSVAVGGDLAVVAQTSINYEYIGGTPSNPFIQSDWVGVTVTDGGLSLTISGTGDALRTNSSAVVDTQRIIHKDITIVELGGNGTHCDYFYYADGDNRCGVFSDNFTAGLEFFGGVGGVFNSVVLTSYKPKVNDRVIYDVTANSDTSVSIDWGIFNTSGTLIQGGSESLSGAYNSSQAYSCACRAFGNTQKWNVIRDSFVNNEITFNLKDSTGTVRNTAVSADGNYNHSEPNMQLSDSGVWELDATSGDETITSPFNVTVSTPSGTGYGLEGNYGEGCYKGDICKKYKSLEILIEQFAKPYINSATSSSITIPQIKEPNVIEVGNIKGLGLIEQFRNGYING